MRTCVVGLWRSGAVAICCALAVIACGGMQPPGDGARDGGSETSVRPWPCPDGWVPGSIGGCLPSVLACGSEDAGVSSGCGDANVRNPMLRPFFVQGDGGIGGGWSATPDRPRPPGSELATDAGAQICSAGWALSSPDRGCEPELARDCAPGSEPVPGGTCTPTSMRACPAGEYPDLGSEPGADRVVHVRAGAPAAGADGTRVRPFPTIAEAITAAGSGGWVLVASGTYPESLTLSAPVHIVAVCSALVTLGTRASPSSVITVQPTIAVDVRGVTITAGATAIITRDGSALRLRNSVVGPAVETALSADGARTQVTVDDTVVANIAASARGTHGWGVHATRGAFVTLTRVVIRAAREFAVRAENPSTRVTLSSSVVAATQSGGSEGHGVGVAALGGASLVATGSLVDGGFGAGAYVAGVGSSLRLESTRVQRTELDATGYAGAISAAEGAQVTLENTAIAQSAEYGLYATTRSRVDVRTSVFASNGVSFADAESGGLWVVLGSNATVSSSRFVDNAGVGLAAGGAETVLTVTDALVRRTVPATAMGVASAIMAYTGAAASLTRVHISETRGHGLYAEGAGTRMAGSLSVVERTAQLAIREVSAAATAFSGARLQLDTVRLEQSEAFGVMADGSRTVFIAQGCDIANVSTGPREYGIGVSVTAGANATIERTAIDNTVYAAIYASDANSIVTTRDSAITNVRANSTRLWGIGVYAYRRANARLASTLIANASEAGLVFEGPGAVGLLEDVVVTDIAPSPRGFGVGVFAFGSSTLVVGLRTAFARISGSALMTTPVTFPGEPTQYGARIVVDHLFASAVSPSTVQLDPLDANRGTGRTVAYGVHVGQAGSMLIGHALIERGGFGFFNHRGSLTLDHAVITRQLDRAGAYFGTDASNEMREVYAIGNADDRFTSDPSLPAGAALAPPTPVCNRAPCE